MSKSANPAAVGAFVIGAIALAVGGVIFFGGGRWFSELDRYVIYFEGSVNGLQIGSPVKMEGVPIGEVCEIRLIADLTEGIRTYSQTVIEVDPNRFEQRGPRQRGTDAEKMEVFNQVVIEIDRSRFKRLGDPTKQQSTKYLIEHGLRARLELQSIITGQLYVSLQMLPESEVRLVGLPGMREPEIPAVPTVTEQIMKTVREAMERLEDLPLEDIVVKLDSVLVGLDRFVNNPEFQQLPAIADAGVEPRDFFDDAF